MENIIKDRRVLSAGQALALDKKVQEELGIPALLLMENAGRAVCQEALKNIKSRKARIAVFCGKGNNGGDGFCCSRHLLTYGVKLDIFLAGKINDVKGQAKVNLDILLKMKQRIIELGADNLESLRKTVRKYNLIIDALLGVGANGQIRGIYPEIIGIINNSQAYILAVDIPSGLDATSGKLLGACVKADKTVTFIARKRGMMSAAGRKFCGEVVVRDIGVVL